MPWLETRQKATLRFTPLPTHRLLGGWGRPVVHQRTAAAQAQSDGRRISSGAAARAMPSLVPTSCSKRSSTTAPRYDAAVDSYSRAQALALRSLLPDGYASGPPRPGRIDPGHKTWRKRNAAMVLATQTVQDFASANLLRTVVKSCPTKLFPANPALDRRNCAELFQLNDIALGLLAYRPFDATSRDWRAVPESRAALGERKLMQVM